MSVTIAELKNRLATTLDECDILDLLSIDTFLLVEKLEDEIIEKYDHILSELEYLSEADLEAELIDEEELSIDEEDYE